VGSKRLLLLLPLLLLPLLLLPLLLLLLLLGAGRARRALLLLLLLLPLLRSWRWRRRRWPPLLLLLLLLSLLLLLLLRGLTASGRLPLPRLLGQPPGAHQHLPGRAVGGAPQDGAVLPRPRQSCHELCGGLSKQAAVPVERPVAAPENGDADRLEALCDCGRGGSHRQPQEQVLASDAGAGLDHWEATGGLPGGGEGQAPLLASGGQHGSRLRL
jgi:hypothetical protein